MSEEIFYEKPNLWTSPGAWLKRKLKLKLSDLVEPFGLRVLERVDFSALKSARPFAHIVDVRRHGVRTRIPQQL